MSQVREILSSLGYRLKDIGAGRFQTSAIFRGGDNESALLINPNGSFVDFPHPENNGSFKKLIALTLGKPYREVEKFLKNKQYEDNEIAADEVDLSNTYPTIYDSPDHFGKLEEDHSYWINRGVPEKLIKCFRGGVVRQKESRMFNRYVLPIFARDGQTINGFAGRALWDIDKEDKKSIKWKTIGKKSEWAYPLFLTEKYIKQKREIIILESLGDVLSCATADIKNTLAPIGIASFEKICSLCIEFDPQLIIIAFNNDWKNKSSGNKAAINLEKMLLNFFNKEKVRVRLPLDGVNDFGELQKEPERVKEWYRWAQK